MICPQCNTENRDGAKFCDECGFRLPSELSTSPAEPAEPSVEASAVEDPSVEEPSVDASAVDESAVEEPSAASVSSGEVSPASACACEGTLDDLRNIDLDALAFAEARAHSVLQGWNELESCEAADLSTQKTGEISPVAATYSLTSADNAPSDDAVDADQDPRDSEEEPERCGSSPHSSSESSYEGGDARGQGSSSAISAQKPVVDLSGFDEYLVDSSYAPPESASRRGDTMQLPPITPSAAERTAFIAPDPAEKGKWRRSKGSAASDANQDESHRSEDESTPSVKAEEGSSEKADSPQRPRKTRIALIGAAAAVAVAVICAGVTYQMEMWGGKIVPDVSSMTQSDAAYILRNKGFEVRITSVPSDETEGIVLLMDPKAGARQEAGSEVVIHVSTSRVIPDVTGKTADEAKKLFEDSGFTNVSFTTEKSDEAEGSVLSVEPAAGSKAKAASAISVVVAEPYTVPDVDGMSVDEAAEAIEEAGLVPSRIIVYNESVSEGTLLGVDPASGTKVESGSTVTISVSKSRGSELVAAARSYLSGASLAASDGSTFAVSSVDSCTYLGSDKVSFTATGRASTSVSVLGQTLSVSGDTKQVTGLVTFDSGNNVTSVSFQ